MRRPLLLASSLLLAPSLPAPAAAQEAIPETVVTATRVPTPAERVPAAATVISRQEIEERGYQTLAEALRAVPGLRLVQTGGIGQTATAFLRGTNSRHVLVLLDGVPVNDPSTPDGQFNFGNELLGDIERIEVVRGPASALYGSGAIGGVVNLVTRRAPQGVAAQGFGELAAGTQRTVRGTLGLAGTLDRFDYMLAGQGLSTRGSDATAPRFSRNTGERDGSRAQAGTARLGVNLAAGTRVEALLRWRETTSGLDSLPFGIGPYDDPDFSTDDRRWYGQLRGETALLDGAWVTGLRVAATQDRRRAVNLADPGSAGTLDETSYGERQVFDWGNRVRLPETGPFRDIALAFGATHEQERVDSTSLSSGFRTATDAETGNSAFHAGLQGRAFGRLDLSAGLRQDESETFGGFLSWNTGAVLALPEIASRLRASAGTAFKAPSLFQRFGRIGANFRGNPELRPERSLSWELGFETDLPGAGREDLATLSATYFDTRIRELIVFGAQTLSNVDRARIRGVELGITLRPADWVEATAAWTIQQARDTARDLPLARRPEHLLSLSARIAPIPRLVIAPELVFTGAAPENAFASYRNDGTTVTQLAYNKAGTLAHLTATYSLDGGISLFAEGRNLTNSRFEPANAYVVPGRSLLVGTRFTF